MITVKQHLELCGKHVKIVTDGDLVTTFDLCGHPLAAPAAEHKVKNARDFIAELRDELLQADVRLNGLVQGRPVKQLVFEPADLQTVFKSIEAGSSNEARAAAYRMFYKDPANKDLVLHVKSCPRIGDLPEGKGEYDVLGFTRPRQKRLKATLAPVEEKKVTNDE